MLCWRARRSLSGYIDGELSPARKTSLEQHLRTCAGCAAAEKRLRSAWADLPSLPEPADTVNLWPGVLRGLVDGPVRKMPERRASRLLAPATVAASVVLGLAVGTVFALQFSWAASARPMVARATADDSFVEAFGDPPLESAAGPRLRPAGLAGAPASQAGFGATAARDGAQEDAR